MKKKMITNLLKVILKIFSFISKKKKLNDNYKSGESYWNLKQKIMH